MLHLRLLDTTAAEQQEALGVFGVNFLHTVFYKWQAIAESVESCKDQLGALLDELTDVNGANRIEVDLMHVDGPDFAQVDNRVLALQLVDKRLTNAVLFNQNGDVTSASPAPTATLACYTIISVSVGRCEKRWFVLFALKGQLKGEP